MIAELPDEIARIEIDRRKPTLQRRHRHAGRRVRVGDGMGVSYMTVEQRVLDETCAVHMPFGRRQNVAVDVDLDEARRGDLAEMHPIGIDQESALFTRHLYGDVIEDQLVPLHVREDAVAGGKLLPRGPFGVGHRVHFQRGRHGVSPVLTPACHAAGGDRKPQATLGRQNMASGSQFAWQLGRGI